MDFDSPGSSRDDDSEHDLLAEILKQAFRDCQSCLSLMDDVWSVWTSIVVEAEEEKQMLDEMPSKAAILSRLL